MSDFKAKMHQIRFQLGLGPRPHWGSLQRSAERSSKPLALFNGPMNKGREERGREGEGKEGKEGEEKERGKGRERQKA